jgi:hypothetical protein
MTLKQLADQILLRRYGSKYNSDADIDIREIYDIIIKEINALIKVEHRNVNLSDGERYVPNAALATYSVPVVSEAGAKTVSKSEKLFGNFELDFLYWSTVDPLNWVQNDGTTGWLSSATSANIATTKTGDSTFDFLITGIKLPKGKTQEDLYRFLLAGSKNAYIRFNGPDDTTPKFFATRGITNLLVGTNFLKFTYTWSASLLLPEDILQIIGSTNNILVDSANYIQPLDSISLVETTIVDTRGRGKITLPTQPIGLPRGMGIWTIGADGPFEQETYIPIQAGEAALVLGITHNGLSQSTTRRVYYEWYNNNTVYFNRSAADLPANVTVRLFVVDPAKLGEYDLLPIPADLEESVILRVLDLIKADGPIDITADKLTQ